jgi:membrane-bound lytic murein transglycosylase D
VIHAFLLIALLLFALPAGATEPAQSLLAELTRPTAPFLGQSGQVARGQDDELLIEKSHPSAVSDIFILENLREKSDSSTELALPDVALPAPFIPQALNSKVEYFIDYFQSKGRPDFSRWLSRSSRYIPMMKEVFKRNGMPVDLVYVAMIESGFRMHARSSANAVGPWQFMSGTGRNYSLRIDQWIDERKEPLKSTMAAALYLKELSGIFNGNWYLAAAGYNAGENKILRAIAMYNTSDFWKLTRGSYLKRETREYVPKLLAAAIIAKDPAHYGFSNVAYLPPIEFDTVRIPTRTNLELVARLTGTSNENIRELNPDLRHGCTPPNYPDFKLKIPKGTKMRFEAEFAKIPEDQRFTDKMLFSHYPAR